MDRTIVMSDGLLDYIHRVGVREHRVLAKCREETKAIGPLAVMQISPEQGAFMAQLVRLSGARRCLEVGSFTGYSALAVALALPEEGRLTACDIDQDFMAKAKSYWREAGVDHKIESRLGPAGETLDRLIEDAQGAAPYDFAFIDADKTNYDLYYEQTLTLVRKGGLIAIDNVLWSGQVIDPGDTTQDTLAIRALNEKIASDSRVEIALTTIGDGIFLCVKC